MNYLSVLLCYTTPHPNLIGVIQNSKVHSTRELKQNIKQF
jgi:hypothetical protein